MDTLDSPDTNTERRLLQKWSLPERYNELPPHEQARVLRSAILAYLRAHGSAAKSVLVKELSAPRADTLQKALDYLSTTQQIYCDDTSGSRDRVYSSNGRLAHPGGERIVDCGRVQYAIRAYNDRWAGIALTITQYAVEPSGEKRPIGGIRVDLRDASTLLQAFTASSAALEGVAERVIAERRPQGPDQFVGR